MSTSKKNSTTVEQTEVKEMNLASETKALTAAEPKPTKDKPVKETITAIPIDKIQPFPNHPFQVNEDEAMERLKESIAENGVLIPALVRQMPDGSFQMVSGHRRMTACKALGIEKLPAIVRDMSDDLATITMVDANSQRESILPSEKAHAYKMRHDAYKHMRATGVISANGRTTEQIGKENSKSYMTVTRYIRMTRLLPDLLKLVDSKKLKETAAERISFLDESEQQIVLSIMESELCVPNKAQAKRLKQLHDDRELTEESVRNLLMSDKSKAERVSIPMETIERFFSEDATPAEMTEAIVAALEQQEKLKAFFSKDASPARMTEMIVKALENEKKRLRRKEQER